jgi:hypothetical protein
MAEERYMVVLPGLFLHSSGRYLGKRRVDAAYPESSRQRPVYMYVFICLRYTEAFTANTHTQEIC